MDAGSVIVLLVVLALVALVGRYLWRRRKSGCIDCEDEACVFHGTAHEPVPGEVLVDGRPVSCPVADRAMADVEAKLGPVGGRADGAQAGGAQAGVPADGGQGGVPADKR